MESFIYSMFFMFVVAFLSPMTWLIALIVGMFFDSLLAIVVVCFVLRGGLGWILWMGVLTTGDTSASHSMPQTDTTQPILMMLLYLIPDIAAIFAIALVTRAIRHAAGYGGYRG